MAWAGNYPGKFSVGGWCQGGSLSNFPQTQFESGAQGIYTTASNRLWTVPRADGTGAVIG